MGVIQLGGRQPTRGVDGGQAAPPTALMGATSTYSITGATAMASAATVYE